MTNRTANTRTMVAAAALLVIVSPAVASPPPVTSTPGSPARLSPDERAHVLDGAYTLVSRVADLPTSVKSAFGGEAFEMADPGGRFQVTDVIVSPGLPRRRLVFGGCTQTRCFVHYEKGGMGHGYYVVLFGIDAGIASFRWGATLPTAAADLPALRSMIQSGEFNDALKFYW